MDLDLTSEESALDGLIDSTHDAINGLIEGAETNGNTYIIQKNAMQNVLHALADLMDAVESGVLRDRPTSSSPPPPPYEAIVERLTAIEAKLSTRNAAAPQAPRTWAHVAIQPPIEANSNPKGRAVTVRPPANKYKEIPARDILQDLKRDLPGAVGVRPLRSGDIRVVFKDVKARDQALCQGDAGESRVLRQDFPAEVAAVPLCDVKIRHGKEAHNGVNTQVIDQITKENRHLSGYKPSFISRLSWIHGNRTLSAGKKRSSLIVYFITETAREAAIRDGITISGVWYSVKLWAHSLSCPRCYNCGLWGHTQSTCAKQARCGHCAGQHDTRNCHQPEKHSCSNCGGKHKQWDRTCPVYQVAHATAAARRRVLAEETIRVRHSLASRSMNAGEPQQPGKTTQSATAQSLAKRAIGRPRVLDKAGSAVGQRPLAWAQPTVEEGEAMEE
jgi:hypothetical protein